MKNERKESTGGIPGTFSIQNAGLYVHIPFCVRKCRYCDFASTEDLSLQRLYAEAVCREMQMAEETFPVFDTLYIGGGTPTAIEDELLIRILTASGKTFCFLQGTEITVEANPGTVSGKSLKRLHQAGVNRLNIGVQSFRDDNLRFLDRIHTAKQAKESIRLARESGFTNIGIDLIFGLPGQTDEAWRQDLLQALAFSPEHLSCYMLTVEESTPLGRDLAAGRVEMPAEETVADLFATTSLLLRSRGWIHYEVSNYAREIRFRSRHNRKYWHPAPTLGLGPAAHSYLPQPPTRWWNLGNAEAYLAAVQDGKRPVQQKETLGLEESMAEALFLSLRTSEGIDPSAFERRFSVSFDGLFGKLVRELEAEGLLKKSEKRWAPTLRGMQFADSLAASFMERI